MIEDRDHEAGFNRLLAAGEDVFNGPDFTHPLKHGFFGGAVCRHCGTPRGSHHFDSIMQQAIDAFAKDDE